MVVKAEVSKASSLYAEIPEARTIAIEIDLYGPPIVKFSGMWHAKDIAVVLGAIRKEYPLYQRSLRRKGLAQGVSNGR
jgi:hypothetical protein